MTKMKTLVISIVLASILSFSGCNGGGGSSSLDDTQKEEITKLDTTKAISNLTTTLPDGSENIPLNENIELKDNVKVLSQEDIDNMTIEQDETDNNKLIITIGKQSSNRNIRSLQIKSINLRAVGDYNIGDIIMIGKDVIVAISNPLNFGYKVISKNGSKIVVKAISNICEALVNGTLSNNPKTLAPFQNNSTISYKKFNGTKEFGTTLKHKLKYEIIPTITLQCRNSELYYMNAGIGGHIDWESSLFDASSYESEEIEIPLATTQINVGKAKIGLFLEFRPSVNFSQNIYNSPKLTLNKEFAFLRTYINGGWSNKEYSKNYMSETKPTFTGVRQNPTTPTISVSLNGKFFVGLGGKVNKKGAEVGMSATIIPTFALKNKDNCKFIDNDMDAKLEVGFDTILGGYTYATDNLSWKLYDDVKIMKLSCGNSKFKSKTINHNDFIYKTIKSPYTEKIWLDRNLGASQICTSHDDESCYGDYYQWGRITDGHEKRNSKLTNLKQSVTSFVASDEFVFDSYSYIGGGRYSKDDWTDGDSTYSTRKKFWSGLSYFYNSDDKETFVCPIEFRVPTSEEFKDEAIINKIQARRLDINPSKEERFITDDAFNGFLKLPSSGDRNSFTGDYETIIPKEEYVINSTEHIFGQYWTASPKVSFIFKNNPGTYYSDYNDYIYDNTSLLEGLPIRCIKN